MRGNPGASGGFGKTEGGKYTGAAGRGRGQYRRAGAGAQPFCPGVFRYSGAAFGIGGRVRHGSRGGGLPAENRGFPHFYPGGL